MKSKESETDKRKREMFRGELKRRDLLEFIRSSGEHGVTVRQIVTHFSKQGKAITRQQVHGYLREPWAKILLHKEGSRYFMWHIVTYDDWSVLSAFINKLQYFSNFKDLWQDREFQSNFQKNSLENMLLQFSNRVGALLSYAIIEALRPTEILKLLPDRQKIAIEFVRDAISTEYLLQTFLATLPYDFRNKHKIGPLEIVTDEYGEIAKDDLGRVKKSTIKSSNIAPEINEFYVSEKQNPLLDLIDAYNSVYPHFHDLLDRSYRKYVNRNQERSTCKHSWNVISIHKIGVGLKCHKCFRVTSEKKFEELLESGQIGQVKT